MAVRAPVPSELARVELARVGCAAALVDEAGAGGHSEDASAMAPPCAATRTRLRRASRGGRRDQPAPQLRSQQLHRRRWPLGPRSVERGQAAILTYTNIKQRPAGAASATGQADGALCASCWRELGSCVDPPISEEGAVAVALSRGGEAAKNTMRIRTLA